MAPAATEASASDNSTLFARIGGQPAVDAAVDIFYNRIIADPQLAPFFEGVDMTKQRRKQVAFMTYIFGGAGEYQGRDLYVAHKKLIAEKGLNEGHFDMVAAHLQETLCELKVPEDLTNEALSVVASAKPVMFGRA